MLVAGDAAGLAYPESGEGIKPAVESGRLAAETLDRGAGAQPGSRISSRTKRNCGAAIRLRLQRQRALAGVTKALGRILMRSPLFTRRVVIDRWFLMPTNYAHSEARDTTPRTENGDHGRLLNFAATKMHCHGTYRSLASSRARTVRQIVRL